MGINGVPRGGRYIEWEHRGWARFALHWWGPGTVSDPSRLAGYAGRWSRSERQDPGPKWRGGNGGVPDLHHHLLLLEKSATDYKMWKQGPGELVLVGKVLSAERLLSGIMNDCCCKIKCGMGAGEKFFRKRKLRCASSGAY